MSAAPSVLRPLALAGVWRAVKELSPKHVRAEAERKVRLGIVGHTELVQDAAEFLVGQDPSAYETAHGALLLVPIPADAAALALLSNCDLIFASAELAGEFPANRVFAFSSRDELPDVVKVVLERPELAALHLPLARAFPALRPGVAAETIQEVSVENAIFVTSTALGNVIPNPLQPLASLAEAMGDSVVLTANQFRMVFKLGAVYGRKVGLRQQAAEVASVVGAAFGWRAVARELVGKIPLGGGVIPKAAIAFAGTWVLGDATAYVYATGKRLTKAEMKTRFNAAYDRGKAVVEQLAAKLKPGRGG